MTKRESDNKISKTRRGARWVKVTRIRSRASKRRIKR